MRNLVVTYKNNRKVIHSDVQTVEVGTAIFKATVYIIPGDPDSDIKTVGGRMCDVKELRLEVTEEES